jgi:hypothetical protein
MKKQKGTSEAEARLAERGPAGVIAGAVHDAAVDSMRHQEIPVLTGALRKSLLDKSDRAHIFEVDKATGRIQYGSRLRQAEAQRHRIPAPDTDAITQAIADALGDLLANK